MGTPKQRHTRARTRKARSHNALTPVNLIVCPKCGSKVLPHHMCEICGTYRGKEILTIISKAEKAKAKADKHRKKNE